MMKSHPKTIEVCADWNGLKNPALVGTLLATVSRGKEIFVFSYDKDWLKNSLAFNLDPALQLLQGPQYAQSSQSNFGLFLDSSPDRFGRLLMNRREGFLARQQERRPRTLLESDYLLGVYDGHRMGALRFRLNRDGPFLDDNSAFASPPWTHLRELEHASLELEKNGATEKKDYAKWLQMLVVPGSSLGGARPKASVVDEKNNLWIAKFPSRYDDVDIGAWEMVLHRLAKQCGIIVPNAQIKRFNSRHHTFLSRRFDRTSKGGRIHFSSAMTQLQRQDGDDGSSGVSYLHLAEFISACGSLVTEDLEQLWRRIVFFMCVSNVDDHLRNHGFLFEPGSGWILSPAFDINPVMTGNGLKLNVSESDNAQDLQLAKDVASHFRVKMVLANSIVKEVMSVVRNWPKEATALKISKSEQALMSPAFRLAEN